MSTTLSSRTGATTTQGMASGASSSAPGHTGGQATHGAPRYARPQRPWSIRLFNALGGLLGKTGLRLTSLDEQSLLAAARRRTGLDDFGGEGFLAPLRILLKAADEEAELNSFGRIMVRTSVWLLLCNRLRVQEQLRRHPEILTTPVRRPLLVLGLPRTGTTLLYNLLAQDPRARPLRTWEAVAPAPRDAEWGRQPDPRIARTRRAIKLLCYVAPALPAVHAIDAEQPEECSRLLMNTFVTAYAVMENHIPSYTRWVLEAPAEVIEASYRDYYRQLQVLQWQSPSPGHWVLKAPVHLFALGPLLRIFPDAAVVQLHRDPCKVVPSLCSLFAVYRGMASDRVEPLRLGPEVLDLCVEGLHRGGCAREAAGADRVLDLKYVDLMADPIAVLRHIHEHFGYEFSAGAASRARQWLDANPQHKHGKHRYDLQQFGLDAQAIERALGPYCRQYGIEPEGTAGKLGGQP